MYQYGLKSTANGFYLETEALRPEPGSYMANMAAASTLFNLNMADRDGKVATGSSLWLRQLGSRTQFDSASGDLDTTINRYVAQLGLDAFTLDLGAKAQATVGVMAAYGRANSTTDASNVEANSKGKVDGYSVGLYGSWFQDASSKNGLYTDSWLQYSWLDGTVEGQNLPDSAKEQYRLKGLSASLEAGYRLPLNKDGLSITPQAQLIWSGVKADSHTEANGTLVESSGQNNLFSRVGLKLQQEHTLATDRVLSTSLEANWLNNSQAAGAILDGVESKQAGNRNIAELKLGMNGQVSKQFRLWGSIGQQLGSNSYRETALTLGFKYLF
ncbi:autotransporter outer membrane beta-barrel domain-containing protein [Neisseriaceae bacterium TC5R-5]|nr:autotransporter outer membrane beta-barrel domain-containing protein [Neisseriaceae bacterium TC5R-5]